MPQEMQGKKFLGIMTRDQDDSDGRRKTFWNKMSLLLLLIEQFLCYSAFAYWCFQY